MQHRIHHLGSVHYFPELFSYLHVELVAAHGDLSELVLNIPLRSAPQPRPCDFIGFSSSGHEPLLELLKPCVSIENNVLQLPACVHLKIAPVLPLSNRSPSFQSFPVLGGKHALG